MIGQTISHYEILEQLGSGGMGVVYKARDTKLDRIVALKFLPANVARDQEVKQRFIQEAKAASSLDDPHICTIFEIGEANDGQLFIAMAFYDGSTLQDLIEKRQIKIDDAASIARQMAKGLSTAHEAGIVHRDVKPANVMVTRKGLVKLLDFGVAKLGESSDLTREGSTIGTASYMSPEQARGEQVDARSDIWSIGAVLYEMLTGARPFGGGYEAAVAYSIINEDPPPVASVRTDAPQGLIDIVNRALSKDADERYPTAVALADALAEFSGETIVETAAQPAYRPSGNAASDIPSVQKLVVRFATGGVLVLALVYAAMMGLGLPGWVFPVAVLLTLVGLPITIYAANVEKQRVGMDSGERAKLVGLKATLSTRLAFKGGLAAAGVLALVIVGYSVLRAAGIGPFASLISSGELDRAGTIILTDFDNRTDIPELGSTVSEALRIDLSQSTALSVMDRAVMSDAMRRMNVNPDTLVSASLGLDIGRREGVKAIIEGDISPVGSSFQLAARVVSTSDEQLLAGFRETAATEADILSSIDRLSARLRAEVGESLVDIRSNPPLDQVSTSSLAALRHYTKANRLQDQAALGEAVREIEQAIALDSLFGMAYRKLAVLYSNAQFRPQAQDSLRQRAYDLRERMTERERLITEGTVYSFGALDIEIDYDKSVRAYEALLEKWPDDLTSLNNLAARYNTMGRHAEAEALFRRALALQEGPFRRANVAGPMFRSRQFDRLNAFLDTLATMYPDTQSEMSTRANMAYTLDDLDGALAWIARRDSLSMADDDPFTGPNPEPTMNLMISQGRYTEMREGAIAFLASSQGQEMMEFREVPDSLMRQISMFVDWTIEESIAHATGDHDRLRAVINDLRAFNGQQSTSLVEDGELTWTWFQELDAAMDYLDETRIDSILALTDQALEEGARYATPVQEQWLVQARAVSDILKGNQTEAALERFRSEIPPSALRDPYDLLGKLEEAAGNTDAAIEAYTRFVSHVSYGLGSEDRGRMGRIHFHLGELHEQQGNLDQAIHHYQKMVDRWKDADAILQPQVEEARRRVDQLLDQKAQEPS